MVVHLELAETIPTDGDRQQPDSLVHGDIVVCDGTSTAERGDHCYRRR